MKAQHALRATQNFLSGVRTRQDTPPPYFLAFRSSVLFINATICLAVFTDIFFYGLIVPVIPFSLTVQVGIPADQVQSWTAVLLACYNATLCVASPLVGWLADRTTSRRVPLLLGLLALAGSTLLLCLGKTIAVLVVGRLLQGLSAAVVWSVGLALLADTVGRDIGKAMGYISIAVSCGLLISPTIGGAVYQAAGYYAVYYVAFAVILLDIILRLLLIEKKVARQWSEEQTGLVSESPASKVTAEPKIGLPPQPANADSQPAETAREVPANKTANDPIMAGAQTKRRNPMLVLISSKRILAALFGCVMNAGAM
jgi:MFS family permease